MKNILIIDDDRDIGILLTRFLKRKGYSAQSTVSADEGLEVAKGHPVDLVICDFKLPGMTGLELIKQLQKQTPGLKAILITGYSDVRIAVQALKQGVYDYVTKPLFPEELLITIKKALSHNSVSVESAQPEKPNTAAAKPVFVEGSSAQSKLTKKHISLIAPTNMTAVITGETGTGKEYTALQIHAKSRRKDKAFVAVDCGALPKELAGSELFGHVKGAFTGAISDKEGCFERAHKGTLFLDEIGNLTYENQVKLLRAIQEREVLPVGGVKAVKVDVRLIVATNENLLDAVANGSFREDLYHRINEFNIALSPLRKRQEDIPIYANHFLQQANKSLVKQIRGFSEKALEKIVAYPWHGNLRELQNAIKRFVLLAQEETIDTDLLPLEILEPGLENEEETMPEQGQPVSLKRVAQMAEKRAIVETLRFTKNNKSKAATLLEIDRKTLYNKLSEYNIST